MNFISVLSRSRVALLAIGTLLLWVASSELNLKDPEIALKIGEHWEDMRQRSTAEIGPAMPRHIWYQTPKSDARLRLVDTQYGFTTPLARFFTVNFLQEEKVEGVRMSPQVEPLLIDEALAIIIDLQKQWRDGGWQVVNSDEYPPFADTPAWRAWMRDPWNDSWVRWRAGDKYQVSLWAARTRDAKRPTEERYLITLELSSARDW